ncbi:MAG: RNA 2'-phosphotransferase [Oscillibacter sp.]|nr:RNA 2'-phosphotransferase [Oscillibacter sp.]
MRNHTRTSKFLSLVLRHKPEKIGITLDGHGWAKVPEILEGLNLTLEELVHIVETDGKQRYSFNEDRSKIRANQGHSIPVDLELDPVEPPERLYHGTVGQFLPSIRREGLTKQSRQYVHLSGDPVTAAKVGSRRGKPIVLQVNAGAMQREGFRFYQAANGVWLTETVPPEYLTLPG